LSGVRHSDVAPARRYIFIYSITSRVSFEVVKSIHEKLLMNLGVNTLSSCILVGNKLDLAPSRCGGTHAKYKITYKIQNILVTHAWGCIVLYVIAVGEYWVSAVV
jgi:hypothetical protein